MLPGSRFWIPMKPCLNIITGYDLADSSGFAIHRMFVTGSTFEPGIPKALFDLSTASLSANDTFAVTADGQRFIFVTQIRETAPSSLKVVINWAADLKK